jgi:hypothetical protein
MSPGQAGGKRGGVLLRVDGALKFVPASVVLRVAPSPRVTAVPGSPPDLLGVAPFEGFVVPVIAIGPARREMVVCQHAGEIVGLLGGEVLRTGHFAMVSGEPDVVEHEGQHAQLVDVAAVYARVQAGARLGRG